MNKRHAIILDLLSKNKKIEVSKLSEMLEVSQVTIRKDLDTLEANGMLKREHGYATLNDSDDINHRLANHYDTKVKIAQLACAQIEDGETILIESGSCCALLATAIAQTKKDVTLITNSAFIADYVRKYPTIEIVLLGGNFQKESQVMVGPLVRKAVQNFFVDKLFIGIDGFCLDTGFTGNDFMRAEAVKDMAAQASRVFVLSDSAKFGKRGGVHLLDLSQVDSVITDEHLPQEMEDLFKEHKINVEKTTS